MYVYPAIFTENEYGYDVSFPDLPGCFTFGISLENSLLMATDALEGYLSVLLDDGDPLPSASAPESFPTDDTQLLKLVSVHL